MENERWSFLKNTPKYDIFFKLSEKMVFLGMTKKIYKQKYFFLLKLRIQTGKFYLRI